MAEYTPRELVARAFMHEETPRVPFSLGFGINPPARQKLSEYLGHASVSQTDEMLSRYDDVRRAYVPYVGPPNRNRTMQNGITVDIWDVWRKPVSYSADGEYHEICRYPLAEAKTTADLDAFDWPDPDWFDYQAIPEILERINPGGRYAIRLGNCSVFESAWYMRGFERTLQGFALEPELIAKIFKRVAAYQTEFYSRALEAAKGGIDIAFTADDIAGQNGMLISPETWSAQIMPWHKKINGALKSFGAKILYHTDGAAQSAIGGMIEMGADGWEALQLDAKGMDAREIKKEASGKLLLHGGISVQRLLPFGNPDEVRSEIFELTKIFSAGGGYIAAPSHAVQAGTPPENIVAMLEAARPDLGPIKRA